MGQNFLVDQEMINSIVERIKKHDSFFVEIGPGLGALTSYFKKEQILLVEKDKKIAKDWKEKNWNLLCQDALKLQSHQLPENFVLFGNLNYEIAASLIIKATVESFNCSTMIFLIQKEMADRVRSPSRSKNYGLLSVISQTYWTIHPVLKVPRHCFYPVPQVSGQVLEFKKKASFVPAPLPFLNFVKKAFQFRRKMLFKSLPVPEPKQYLKEQGFNPNCRAEDLSPKDFVKLFQNQWKE